MGWRIKLILPKYDRGFRTSVLVREYRSTLPPGVSGAGDLCASSRVCSPKTIEKFVPRNKNDRVISGAAHGSLSKVLVSDDDADFPESARSAIRKKLAVDTLGSAEAGRHDLNSPPVGDNVSLSASEER